MNGEGGIVGRNPAGRTFFCGNVLNGGQRLLVIKTLRISAIPLPHLKGLFTGGAGCDGVRLHISLSLTRLRILILLRVFHILKYSFKLFVQRGIILDRYFRSRFGSREVLRCMHFRFR